jgi:hypothetical protein
MARLRAFGPCVAHRVHLAGKRWYDAGSWRAVRLPKRGGRMHPTYKHLGDRVRLGGLTLGQWTQLLACALPAYALSTLLPLPGSWSLSVAVTVCGLPAAGAIAFMSADFDVVGLARAAVRWQRSRKRYAGSALLSHAETAPGSAADRVSVIRFDAEGLWD